MIRGERRLKLRSFLMLFSLVVVFVISLLIATLFNYKTKLFIQEKINHIQAIKVNQIQFDILHSFDDAYNVMDLLRVDERIAQYIGLAESGAGVDSYTKATASADVETLLFNLKKDNPFFGSILIQTGRAQYSSDRLYSANLPLREPASGEKPILFVNKGQAYRFFGLQPSSVTDARMKEAFARLNATAFLWSSLKTQDGKLKGDVFLLLDDEYFKSQIPYSGNMALLDADRNPLFIGSEVDTADLPRIADLPEGDYQPGQHGLNSKSVTVKRIVQYDFSIIYEENGSIHRKQFSLILKLLAIMLASCAILTVIVSPLVSGATLRPLARFMKQIKGYEALGERLAQQEEKRSLSLQARLLLYFAVTILLPILLFIVSFYSQSTRIAGDELRDSYTTVFQNTTHRIESFIDQKSVGLARLSYDLFLRRLLAEDSPNSTEDITNWIRKNEYLGLARDTISIYDKRNRLLYSNFYPMQSSEDDTAETVNQSKRGLSYELYTDRSGTSYIRLGAAIYNNDSKPIGMVRLDVNSLFFSNLYADFKENNSSAYIVDDKRTIVSHSDPNMIGRKDAGADKADEYRVTSKLAHLPWYFVSEFDSKAVRKQTHEFIYDDISIVLGLLLLTLLFAFGMSRYLVRPFNEMVQIGTGQEPARKLRKKVYGIEEVNQLSQTYNRMLERIELLVDESLIANHRQLRLEYEKRESQLLALQMQINPHFLYNTLESLVYTIEKRENDKAVDMIHLLSRLFRYMTSDDRTIVSLREELAYAKSYVQLMTQRHEGPVDCRWIMDNELLDCGIVKFVLQPIIENVFHHGFPLSTPRLMRIEVRLVREGDLIRITVTDNADGITSERLQEIRSVLQDNDGSGIGIYNVNKRLKLHYGADFGLTVESVVQAGTAVAITIPYYPIRN